MSSFRNPAQHFVHEVRRHYDVRDVATFWQCESGLRTAAMDGSLSAWVNAELRRLVLDNSHAGDWHPNEVTLYRDDYFTLSLALFSTPRRYIHILPFYAMYVPLCGPLTYDRYELPSNYRNDVFDPSLTLTPAGTHTAPECEVIRINSERYGYDLKVTQPSPILRLATSIVRPLEWLFSRTTLQAWQANDADLTFTQLRVAAHVLGRLAHQSSIGPLRRLTSHPHHAVRWAAIQNLGRLNRSEAIVKIRDAVHDTHPHVRRAAQRTLERLRNPSEDR